MDIVTQIRLFFATMWADANAWAEYIEEESALARDSRAQGGNLSGLMVGIGVAAIIGIGVVIPIVNDVIASSSVSGITATILGFIPIMLGLLIFVASASPIMNRT
jgi:VIT1/CCC1 family predicted Fe2+/Mn2+ transporter